MITAQMDSWRLLIASLCSSFRKWLKRLKNPPNWWPMLHPVCFIQKPVWLPIVIRYTVGNFKLASQLICQSVAYQNIFIRHPRHTATPPKKIEVHYLPVNHRRNQTWCNFQFFFVLSKLPSIFILVARRLPANFPGLEVRDSTCHQDVRCPKRGSWNILQTSTNVNI